MSVSSGDGEVELGGYLTIPGYPGTTQIQAGIWTFNIYHYVNNTAGDTTFVYRVYKIATGGAETELFNVTSDPVDATSATLVSTQYVLVSPIALDATDRLICKVFAQTTSGASITAHFVYEGSTHVSNIGSTLVVSGLRGATGSTGAASTVPGSTGATGAASTVPGSTGATGAASTVPGSTGATGAASTVPGATGATGAASTVPGSTGATGAASTVPGSTGATGAASTVPGVTGATGAAGATGVGSTGPQGATGPLISASDEQTLSYDAGLPGWRARDSLKVGNDGIVGIHRGSTGACGDLRAYNDNDTSYGRLHMNDNNIDFDILVEGAAPRDITVGRGGDMGAFWVGPDPGNDQRPSFKHSGHPDGNTGITMESYVEDEASDKNYRFTGVDRFHFDGYLGIPAGSGGKFVHNGATGIDDIIHAIGEDFTVSGGIVTEATATTSIAGYPADGRLTLTSGTPVTTSDVTAATTLYYTPYIGNKIALYDGSNWDILEFTEISTACDAGVAATLDATQMYDVFVYNDSGTATLELLAWTDDSTRATALVYQDGVLVKSGAATRRYIGSFRTGGSGVTDALKYRTLWNTYNRVDRKVYTSDSNAHSYTTTSWRLWRNTTSNEVFVVSGLEEDAVTLTCNGYCDVDSAYMGIDEDGTTPDNTLDPKIGFVKTGYHFVIGTWTYYPAAGYHYYALCQYGGSGADFNYGTMVGKVRC